MPEKHMKVYPVFAVSMFLVSVAPLLLWPVGMLFSLLTFCILVLQSIIIKITRPDILKRSLPLGNWWERILTPLIAVLAVATAALSVYDVAVLHASVMLSLLPMLLGIGLLMSAFMIAAQALRAQPPHGEDKYGEAAAEGRERGPYEVVRHPMMLAILLSGLSIPLCLGSGIGFIPAGLLAAVVIARTAAEDDWRFNNYEWFYDYTKEVSYRLIPFIW